MRGNHLRCRTRIHVPYPREGKAAMLISRCPTPPSFLCLVCLVPSPSAVITQGETRTRRCATRRRKCINVVTGFRTSHLVIMMHTGYWCGVISSTRKRKRYWWREPPFSLAPPLAPSLLNGNCATGTGEKSVEGSYRSRTRTRLASLRRCVASVNHSGVAIYQTRREAR